MASAFYVSPFDQAAVLSADGLGDFASSMWALGEGSRMEQLGEVSLPAFARHVLHRAHAIHRLLEIWRRIQSDGPRRLRPARIPRRISPHRLRRQAALVQTRSQIFHASGSGRGHDLARRRTSTPVLGRLFSTYLEKRLGPARKAEEPLEQRHHNLAASMQAALEEVLAAHWNALAEKTKQKNLCLAGGVAFNCVANGKIFDTVAVRARVRAARCG